MNAVINVFPNYVSKVEDISIIRLENFYAKMTYIVRKVIRYADCISFESIVNIIVQSYDRVAH